jgi:hypothetical protein
LFVHKFNIDQGGLLLLSPYFTAIVESPLFPASRGLLNPPANKAKLTGVKRETRRLAARRREYRIKAVR